MKIKKNDSLNNQEVHALQKNKKTSQMEKNYENEENLLKKIILFLVEKNYKYISYAYGGFESIHNQILNNKNKVYSKIKIINHIDEKCEICKINIKSAQAKIRQSQINSTKKFSDFLKFSIKDKNEIKKNATKIKEQNYKSTTIDEVNKMISSTNYFAGPCNFVLDKISEKENDEIQGLLIIYEKKLFCIKTPTQKNKPLQIIHEIFLNKIKDFKIKEKLFCYIYFINEKQFEENIIIKFNSDINSEKFVESFNKAKKEV